MFLLNWLDEPSTLAIVAAAFLLGVVIGWFFTIRQKADQISGLTDSNRKYVAHIFQLERDKVTLASEVASFEQIASANGWTTTNLSPDPATKMTNQKLCPLCHLPLASELLFHSRCAMVEQWVNEAFESPANNLPEEKL